MLADASGRLSVGVTDDALHEDELIFNSIGSGHEEAPSPNEFTTALPMEADYTSLSPVIEIVGRP